MIAILLPAQGGDAVALGETRTLHLIHAHTKETITVTYMVNGQYDSGALQQLNWFLRDWRRDEPTKMDARLFDVVWEAYRESGSREPIMVMSAYRSPETNSMLRGRSRAVAKFSQHILGKAMDQHYFDVPMSRVREIAMKIQRGGVGYYPTAGSPFVHMDVGTVRSWPRMSYDQLARIFPDGKTVHIPANGQPMARYEEARAEIESAGYGFAPESSVGKPKNFFAMLFGGDDDEGAGSPGSSLRPAPQERSRPGNSRTQQIASVEPANDSSATQDSLEFFRAESERNNQQTIAPPVAAHNEAEPAKPEAIRASVQLERSKPLVLPEPLEVAPTLSAKTNEPVPTPGVPLPQRRPSNLIATLVDVPLPPTRPSNLSATAVLAPTPRLPDVITKGSIGARTASANALGYTSSPELSISPIVRPADVIPQPPVRTPVITKATKVMQTIMRVPGSGASGNYNAAPTVAGLAAPALRSKTARSQSSAYFAAPVVLEHFSTAPNTRPTNRFSQN